VDEKPEYDLYPYSSGICSETQRYGVDVRLNENSSGSPSRILTAMIGIGVLSAVELYRWLRRAIQAGWPRARSKDCDSITPAALAVSRRSQGRN